MPNITAPALTFPSRSFPTQQAGAPTGLVGELIFSELLGKYSSLVKAGKVFYTSASITAPVIFSTAAQLGPMLWNKQASGVDAHILGVATGCPSTATTVASSLGLATNVQPATPTTATAITAVNAYSSGGTSQMAGIFSTATVLVTNPVPIFLQTKTSEIGSFLERTGCIFESTFSQGVLCVVGFGAEKEMLRIATRRI